ncbi:Wzz/FepE/Etk N-terminal domain-containing protein [Metasolibacillus sp. FSL K6-0083]|uniref:Wzz/FepE/Etk N-terminal domain-containing protein n=1 Tax=Metasolibacillus sp. FSL K6-0083 TaxID=2921416 RepID=UPI00315B19D8
MSETIELRQLVDILLKGKVVIASTTIAFMLVAGILSWFVINEKYESSAVIQVVGITANDSNVMASYLSAEFMPNTYVERVKNQELMEQAFQQAGIKAEFDLRNLTTIVDNDPLNNYVQLSYKARTAAEAQQQMQILVMTTKDKMSKVVRQHYMTIEQSYEEQVQTLSKEVEATIEVYNQTVQANDLPKVLIMQTVLNSEIALQISDEQTEAFASIDGQLQNQLLQLQTQIQTKSAEYRKALANFQEIQLGLENFSIDSHVRTVTEPTLEKKPISPNKAINIAIAAILGLMVSVGAVFFRYYWKNSSPMK